MSRYQFHDGTPAEIVERQSLTDKMLGEHPTTKRWEEVQWVKDESHTHNGAVPSSEVSERSELSPPSYANSLDSQSRQWPTLGPDAFHGLAGDIVTTLSPNTEADEAGLLLTFLVSFGAIVGPGPHALAGDEKHPARLFTVLVGKTSRGRKGTAYASVKRIFEVYDRGFMLDQTLSGIGSGEGLIHALSDTEDGPTDRRVLVYEPEFARVLKVCSREGSTLSAILRDAWDRGSMRVATRKDPLKVDGAHICAVSHITTTELRRYLTETEIAGGLGNRFLLACVQRSKKLPTGGNLSPEAVQHFALGLGRAVGAAKRVGLMTRTPGAEALWADIYNAVDDDVDGLFGAIRLEQRPRCCAYPSLMPCLTAPLW